MEKMVLPDFGPVNDMLDSVYVELDGKCVLEEYREPYGRESLHRMFSVTKSYCGLAILALVADRRLGLDDCIVTYFPEYVGSQIHPWLKEMTIRHMMTMRTCHAKTTFHTKMATDWTESFFTTAPNHRSGQIFQYDTSSSHTLAALIKKMTGKGVLDYLREIFLEKSGFSKQAYILKDPFGVELGGSGLMAKTSDLACTAQLLLALVRGDFFEDPRFNGYVTERYPECFWKRYAGLVKEATSFQTLTCHFGQTADEQQGYGMQFWMVRNGGAAMYGLGGQYAILFPEQRLFVVTTADTQNVKGGNQKILDCIHQYVERLKAEQSYCLFSGIRLEEMNEAMGEIRNKTMEKTPAGEYEILQTEASLKRVTIQKDMLKLSLETENGKMEAEILFSVGKGVTGRLCRECEIIYTRAEMYRDSLYLQIKNCDTAIGLLHILIHFEGEDRICLYMRTAGLEGFEVFNGFFDGKRIHS